LKAPVLRKNFVQIRSLTDPRDKPSAQLLICGSQKNVIAGEEPKNHQHPMRGSVTGAEGRQGMALFVPEQIPAPEAVFRVLQES
jgi:hypothetical protein